MTRRQAREETIARRLWHDHTRLHSTLLSKANRSGHAQAKFDAAANSLDINPAWRTPSNSARDDLAYARRCPVTVNFSATEHALRVAIEAVSVAQDRSFTLEETPMKLRSLLMASALFACLVIPVRAQALEVNITADLPAVEVMHAGQKVVITRNQNQANTINPDFAKTSRPCPPYCIQPSRLAPGVDTIGELEVLHYLKKMSDGDTNIVVVDSRTPDWVTKGTIPGSINIPWTQLNIGQSDPITVEDLLGAHLGVKNQGGFYMYDKAKTVVMFCNGAWCGQSPTNIKGLLKIGYPADKIKWYRGGMQDWEMLGLTTVKGAK